MNGNLVLWVNSSYLNFSASYIELSDNTIIIIEISHDRCIIAKFAFNNKKEPNRAQIDIENLLQITRNFIFVQ